MKRSVGLSALVWLLLASCSVPAQVMPPRTAPVPDSPPTVSLICHAGAHFASFAEIGVPSGEWPVDVAITRRSVWVLFEQGRLLQLDRRGEPLQVQMHVSSPAEEWTRMDVDPLDESVWVVSRMHLDLLRVSPEGGMSRVKLQRKVEGAGGFADLRVGRDAIYAQPLCAEAAVWRLDREGKLLAAAFPAPERSEAEEEREVMTPLEPGLNCYGVWLDRDAEGRILAWEYSGRATWQVDEHGVWTRSDSALLRHLDRTDRAISLKGANVGEESERWYYSGYGHPFFWKGQPVYLGSWAHKERHSGQDTVLVLSGEQGPREVFESCRNAGLWKVATDAAGYAAITNRFVVFGEFVSAPDLP